MLFMGIFAAIVGGSVGVYYGFVDDTKWLFALGAATMAFGVLATFTGAVPPSGRVRHAAAIDNSAATMLGGLGLPTVAGAHAKAVTLLYVVGVLTVTLASSVGVYFAFVEDIKALLLLGLAGWAVAVVTTFRGSLGQ